MNPGHDCSGHAHHLDVLDVVDHRGRYGDAFLFRRLPLHHHFADLAADPARYHVTDFAVRASQWAALTTQRSEGERRRTEDDEDGS